MDDPISKLLRDRLDALLRRAREISADIERRVDAVNIASVPADAPTTILPEAAAVTAEASAASAAAGTSTAPAAADHGGDDAAAASGPAPPAGSGDQGKS